MTNSDPGVVTVRPFTLDDLEAAADFCERARQLDPAVEPFAQRLALIATGPRAVLPLWQVAQGEDGLVYGIAFAAVRETRDPTAASAGKLAAPPAPAPGKAASPALARPPRQPYAAGPGVGALAGVRAERPGPNLPVAPELPQRPNLPLRPARPPEPAPASPQAPRAAEESSRAPAPREQPASAPREQQAAAPGAPTLPQRTTLEIYAAVHPPLRRQGLGRALLEPLVQWAQGAGEPVALRARVNDAPGSSAGLAFLRALGFRESRAQLTLNWTQAPLGKRELPALAVRQLAPGDAAGLAQLARLSDAAWSGAPDAFPTRADELAQLMSELGRLVILASAEGRGVGYLSGVWLGKTLGIEEVAVLPDFRRAGVGRALVTFALERNARAAVLSVGEENRAARALYRSLGFTQTARKLILVLEGG